MSTPAIRIRKASTNCASNLKFFYIKTGLDVHLVNKEVGYYGQEEVCLRKLGYVAVPKEVGYYGQEEVCLRKLGYVAVPSSLT